MTVVKGIALGIGLTVGFAVTILFCFLLAILAIKSYKHFSRNSFSVELFSHYYQELIRKEKFEELEEVKIIISKLKKKDKPKELLKKYKVSVHSYLYWKPTQEGGDRLILRRDKKIIKK
ncbi:MAG: hypothetical protein CSA05_00645 [Bacteroidia bacterium]|nr:MAG: hypothetical protein CSB01_00400 [Bacteroidia bacterium]PIE86405.1 MAG: hypothetical protein CSA05_00645 [Bacteroidia bacterium]